MQEKSSFAPFGKPIETKIQKPTPADPLFKRDKTVGSGAAIMDFSKMLEFILKDEQTFNNLPRNLQGGLRKVYKMTLDPFKYASEEVAAEDREAFIGLGGPVPKLKALQDTLTKALSDPKLPKLVSQALLDAQKAVEKELEILPTRREIREDKKREDVIQRQTQREEKEKQEDTSIDRLKRMLMGSRHYADVYPRLPFEIRREMEKLSLDPENIKYLASQRQVFASRAVVSRYLSAATQERRNPA